MGWIRDLLKTWYPPRQAKIMTLERRLSGEIVDEIDTGIGLASLVSLSVRRKHFINLDGKEVDIIEDIIERQTRFLSAKL